MSNKRFFKLRGIIFILFIVKAGADGVVIDSDGDGVIDSEDNCREIANVDQLDIDCELPAFIN